MGSTDQFNIRWNNYTSVLQTVFRKLLEGEQFVDVTLACEGQSIKCHRIILSACSTYFDRLLSDNTGSNVVIYLKDMKFWELRALVTFMYNGEVSISQQKLPHLCKAAEALKIKGLAHDTGYNEDNVDEMEEEEMEDFGGAKEIMFPPQQQHLRNSLTRPQSSSQQPKSLLRQHNTLSNSSSGFLTINSAGFRSTQQVKRKILSQPPKLMKMQKIERPSNGTGGHVGITSPVKPQLTSAESNIPFKKNETVKDEEEDEVYPNEISADSSMKDDVDGGAEEEENEEMEAGEEESVGSEIEGDDGQQEQAGRPRAPMKYDKEVRDSALNALQSGMTLRQCSETYGIPRKTLSKWKSREQKNETEETSPPPARMSTSVNTIPMVSTSGGVVLPPKTTMGAPVDSADRAERLKKATELALSGVTVRQAAAHFEIPRTTLCAYMKRRGLAGKRNFFPNNNGQTTNNNAGASTNALKRAPPNKGGEGASVESNGQANAISSHYEDFPFLGISELMDEMGQGGYEAQEEYAEAEEEYTDK